MRSVLDFVRKVHFTRRMNCIRTKREAIKLFGGTMKAVGDALDITRQAVSQWPEDLPQDKSDRLVGAAVRHGLLVIASDSTSTPHTTAAQQEEEPHG